VAEPPWTARAADRAAVRATLARITGTVAAACVLYALAPLDARRWYLDLLAGVLAVAGFVVVIVARARRLRTSPRALLEALEALALAMSLLVFGFAAVHFVLAEDGQFQGIETKLDAVYFTVVTLGTVGFGDITPTGQGARLAVTLQIVFTLSVVGAALKVVGEAAMSARRDRT
jgi:voltage-gated potassium channel